MKKLVWLISLALAVSLHAVPMSEPLWQEIETLSTLTARVAWMDYESYYGTSLLYKINDQKTKLFFVTNAHLLPRDVSRWNDMFLLFPFLPNDRMPMQVVGVAPGHDLAVLSVDRPKVLDDKRLEDLKTLLVDSFAETIDLAGKALPAGFLGTPSYNVTALPYFMNVTWQQEGISMSNFAEPLVKFQNSTKGVVRFYVEDWLPTTVNLSNGCPPFFIERCYFVDMLSWGWSGGGFVVNIDGNMKIAGIISHYIPMTPFTYIIPISEAFPIVQQLIDGTPPVKQVTIGKGDTAKQINLLVEGYDGEYEIVSRNAIKIKKTRPLIGTVVQSLSTAIAPSSKVGGGPGEGHGGGGPGEGHGGGEPFFSADMGFGETRPETDPVQTDQYYVIGDPYGNFSGLSVFNDLMNEVSAPEKWLDSNSLLVGFVTRSTGMRGIEAFIRRKPGVVLITQDELPSLGNEKSDKPARIPIKKELVYGMGDDTIDDIQSFLRTYLKNPNAPRRSSVRPVKEFPKNLVFRGNKPLGMYGVAAILRLKTGNEIKTPLTDSKVKSSYTVSDGLAMVAYVANEEKISGKKVDLVSMRFLPTDTAITEGSLRQEGQNTTLELAIPRLGKQFLELKYPFVRTGDYSFQYIGSMKATMISYEDKEVEDVQTFHGIITVQFDTLTNSWTVEGFTSSVVSPSPSCECCAKHSPSNIADIDNMVGSNAFFFQAEESLTPQAAHLTREQIQALREAWRYHHDHIDELADMPLAGSLEEVEKLASKVMTPEHNLIDHDEKDLGAQFTEEQINQFNRLVVRMRQRSGNNRDELRFAEEDAELDKSEADLRELEKALEFPSKPVIQITRTHRANEIKRRSENLKAYVDKIRNYAAALPKEIPEKERLRMSIEYHLLERYNKASTRVETELYAIEKEAGFPSDPIPKELKLAERTAEQSRRIKLLRKRWDAMATLPQEWSQKDKVAKVLEMEALEAKTPLTEKPTDETAPSGRP